MKYDENYRLNRFITLDNGKSSLSKDSIHSISVNLSAFEYFSGVVKINAEYNYFYQSYYDILDSLAKLKNNDEFFSEYKEELESKMNQILDYMDKLSDQLYRLSKIEEDILKGKQLLIIRHHK